MLSISVVEVDPVVTAPELLGQRIGDRNAAVLPARTSDGYDKLVLTFLDITGDKK